MRGRALTEKEKRKIAKNLAPYLRVFFVRNDKLMFIMMDKFLLLRVLVLLKNIFVHSNSVECIKKQQKFNMVQTQKARICGGKKLTTSKLIE